MEFQDMKLKCADCDQEFIFKAGEQQFYQERGFTNLPKRCEDCRSKRKAHGHFKNKAGSRRASHPAVCSRCGSQFNAPFQPKEGRPLFCRKCFEETKTKR